jgi:hypothetical protein
LLLALQSASSGAKPAENTSDAAARKMYVAEAEKLLAACSILLRTSFPTAPSAASVPAESAGTASTAAAPSTKSAGTPSTAAAPSTNPDINSIVSLEGDSVTTRVPTDFQIQPTTRGSYWPALPKEQYEQFLKDAKTYLTAVALESLRQHGKADPMKFVIPVRLLVSWNDGFLGEAVDHTQLAQVQHNWRQSLNLHNILCKEGHAAAQALKKHLDQGAKEEEDGFFS